MGEKKKKNNNKGAENEEAKKEDNSNAMVTMVFKTEMHCEGCASKILKFVKSIEGVEKAKTEWEADKLTVVGEVNPLELRDMLLEKTKKKVELVSPQVKKDKENKADNNNKSNKSNNNNNKNNPQDKKSEDKKPKEKEPPVTTADLKVDFHCSGCIVKMHKIVSKAKGLQNITINKEKNLITVKGTMDVKEIAQSLKDKMKRQVEIVAPKKEKDKDGSNGGDGAEKEGGGGGGKKKKKKGSGGGDGGDGGNEEEGEIDGFTMQGSRVEYYGPPPPQGYGAVPMQMPIYGYPYGYMYGHPFHAPQIFSDENPNACSVM